MNHIQTFKDILKTEFSIYWDILMTNHQNLNILYDWSKYFIKLEYIILKFLINWFTREDFAKANNNQI